MMIRIGFLIIGQIGAGAAGWGVERASPDAAARRNNRANGICPRYDQIDRCGEWDDIQAV
jgi:hypothetical protein